MNALRTLWPCPRKSNTYAIDQKWKQDLPRLQHNDPSLTEVFAYPYERCLAPLARALLRNTHLRTLMCRPPDRIRAARALARGIRSSQITRLIVDFSLSPSPEQLVRVMRILYLQGVQQSATIQELELDGRIGDISALIEIIPHLRKLSLIHLSDHAGLLVRLPFASVETLEISHCDLREENFGILVGACTDTLILLDCQLPIDFLDEWPLDSSLKKLDLRGCHIASNVAVSIVEATANHPALETLNVHNNVIDYLGLEAIATILARNTLTLKHLDLTECGSYNRWYNVILVFLRAVQTNTHLHTLRIPYDDWYDDYETIRFYLAPNRWRTLLTTEHGVPPGIWCHVMAHYKHNASCIYGVLQQQPVLMNTHQYYCSL